MKKILIIFLSFILFLLPTYAETWDEDIVLSTQELKVKVNDTFNINFSINLDSSNNIWDITIEWIQKFSKLWESSSFRFESVNWINKWIYDKVIKLKPTQKWKFVVWPVIVNVWNKTQKSNTIEIEVVWENNSNNTVIVQDTNSKMEDINDIAWPKNTFNFSFLFIIVFFLILFFVWFFYLLRYYFSFRETEFKKEKISENENISKNNYFLNKLNSLQKKSDIYSKSEFFSLLNDLLREYLEHNGIVFARNMTLKELEQNKKNINPDLFEIIKDTYFEEFRKNDSDLDRKLLLKKIKSKLEV